MQTGLRETDSETRINVQDVYAGLGVPFGSTLGERKGGKQDWAEGEVGLRFVSTEASDDLVRWRWRTLELGWSSRVVRSWGKEARPFSSLVDRTLEAAPPPPHWPRRCPDRGPGGQLQPRQFLRGLTVRLCANSIPAAGGKDLQS